MFDPLLRALKGSQLIFVSLLLSFSTFLYAADSGPELETEPEVIEETSLVISSDSTEVLLVPVVNDEAELVTEPAAVGPSLVDQNEEAPLASEVVLESEKTITNTKSEFLGPLLNPPKVTLKQGINLFPRFPANKFTYGNEEESLDLLWQKTFPLKKKAESKKLEITQESIPDTELLVESPMEEDTRPTITIIIDDLGYNRRGMEESLSLPVEVALAILPHTPFSKKTALAATEQARTIMLHVPMENERELKLGPGGLYKHMNEAELKKTLKEGIESVPGVTGINNHMGSLLTQDKEKMKWVMEVIQPLELFFVDSLTSPNSVALANANHFNLTTTIRDVFLDNVQNEKAIDRQFRRLIAIAKKRGRALAIGHPYPTTMSYLSKRLAKLDDEGVRLVSIGDYVQ